MNRLLIFLVLLPFVSQAQFPDQDWGLIQAHVTKSQPQPVKKVHLHTSANPLKMTLYIPLYFYQKILSEQIAAVCEFDRSCSNFGLASIKEFGIIKGVSLTADRLTRCNGLAQLETENYLINHINAKVIDEPSMYRFKD